MFGKKTEDKNKLPGPKAVPPMVAKYLTEQFKLDPDLVNIVRSVSKPENGDRKMKIRIYDEAETAVKKIQVKDFNSFDEFQNLVIYEGTYDESDKKVDLSALRNFGEPAKIFSEDEIQKKIEALSELGSSVYFYTARGSNMGGPLGRGAVIVKVNPEQKGKHYVVYTADVDGTEPVKTQTKLWDSNKPKDIAKWIKDCHTKRLY